MTDRDKMLIKAASGVVDAYDNWAVMSYPVDGGLSGSAQAWFSESQQVEIAIEALRTVLATHGDRKSTKALSCALDRVPGETTR